MIAYYRPTTLDAALVLRARYADVGQELKLVAGATDVLPAKATRAGWGEMSHPDVLDLTAIDRLRGISRDENGWRIGALATWTDINRADLPPAFDGLKEAARQVGGLQIQNRGTLVGNVCNASPAADGVPCLMTLGAEVQTASGGGGRRLPLEDFILGNRRTALRADEIVAALVVPDQPGRGRFLKLGARRYLVISIAMAAGVIDHDPEGRVMSARIAIGSCAAVARRQPRLEALITGRDLASMDTSQIADAMIEGLAPIDDVRSSARYRGAAAVELVRDLVSAFTLPSEREAA